MYIQTTPKVTIPVEQRNEIKLQTLITAINYHNNLTNQTLITAINYHNNLTNQKVQN
jgi:hypothetical protein